MIGRLKIKIKNYNPIIFVLICNSIVYGQNNEVEHHDDHEHAQNEIGVANAPVYFINEKEWSYSLHLHYMRSINESAIGIGMGYEQIFDDHQHKTIGIVGSYRPMEGLSLNLSPGITFEGNDTSELNFAVHFEVNNEFEVGVFHIGPVADIAYDPEDYHLSLGLHIGYGF